MTVSETLRTGAQCPWDHVHDDTLVQDLWGWFRRNRDVRAFKSTLYGGFWVLTQYQDIFEAYRRSDLFSVETIMVPKPAYEHKWIPGEIDPPAHSRYRRMLLPLFGPARVAALEPTIRTIARELVSGWADAGGCEVIRDFAGPLPSLLFASNVGVPAGQIEEFRAVSLAMVCGTPGDQEVAHARLSELLQEVIDRRRAARDPGQDWLTPLITADEDGVMLTPAEMLNAAQFLFLAGLITVTSFLTTAFAHLATRPDAQLAIAGGEIPVESVTEELLRVCGNVAPCRQVRQDVEFAGVQMRKGDVVMLSVIPANLDPDQFPAADEFDLRRQPNRHLTFGAGIHRCLGAHLARREIAIALQEFHSAVPSYMIAPGQPTRWMGGVNQHLDRLALAW
jgi:cytochrome P450